ncbi:YoaK family protein [Trinickia violacea]|uniref:YoaK family protein n=1 Tax=Trinickia violacea TaxID=2571746 RepID=UPI0020C755B7|nr:YoaK family protein [Trinickia violacea]
MPQRLITVLAFLAGYVDTFGFVGLFGLFTSHVTTNFVLIGANIVGQGQGVLLKLSAFPAFIAGVAVAKCAVEFSVRRGVSAERAIYVLQAVCLSFMMFAGLAALPVHSADSAAVIVAGLFGAIAMGIQNGHSQLVLAGKPLTTTMTQNITLGVIDAIEAMMGRGAETKAAARARFADTLLPVCGFAVGAIVAAIAWVQASFWALLFPVTLLAILALRASTEACAVGE